jgi:predicted component of type VI protein secretion system
MPRVVITVPGKNSQPYRFSLDRKIVRIGRAADSDIIVDCPSVSSHHCEMRRVEGGYILQDLDSTNGIKAAGTPMEILDLDNDTEVLIGDADLDFELTDDEHADLKGEAHKPHAKPKLPPLNDADDDFDEDDEEEAPKKLKKPKAASKPRLNAGGTTAVSVLQSAQSNAGVNFAISMIFLGLAVVALYLGMSTRHQTQFDRNLWNDWFGTPDPTEAPAEEK